MRPATGCPGGEGGGEARPGPVIGRRRRQGGGRAGRSGRRVRRRAGKMLLSLALHMYSMRCVLPAAVLLGTAPTYVLVWGAWRLLSALLPSRLYQTVDDRLYRTYQSMVLFFFENYTGVQVRRRALCGVRPRGRAGGSTAPAWNRSAPPGPLGSFGPAWPIRPRRHVPSPRPPTVGGGGRFMHSL